MNKRKLEEEIFQQNKFEKLNNIADSEDDDSVDENNYDVMQEQDIEGKNLCLILNFLHAISIELVSCVFGLYSYSDAILKKFTGRCSF